MGSTKKEARKVAAANLLLLFQTKGENIDPCKVKKVCGCVYTHIYIVCHCVCKYGNR